MAATNRRRRPGLRTAAWRAGGVGGSLALVVSLLGGVGSAAAQAPAPQPGTLSPIVPIDEQRWTDQADMTWDDYVPIRPDEWNSVTTSQGSEVTYKTAVILLDFTDQPFLVTQPPDSHPFGNPQSGWVPVPTDQVNDWFRQYYEVPNQYNGGQTFHGYWMEDSHGRIGVDVEVFGPYTLPGKLHEYGYDGSFNSPLSAYCPQGDTCGKNIRNDGAALWRAAIGCTTGLCGFDNGFYVTAGHDESSTWQEFGDMLFETKEEIPDAFGPPRGPNGEPPLDQNGNPMPNWARTRYVEWTSWKAAANHWPNAGGGTSTQAESSGQSVFAHEFSHLRGLPDNYNNPFADTDRNYTGYWEMMSRGTFNGPGGTHNRWQIPNAGGSGLGPHHMLHFKTAGPARLGVVTDDEQVVLDRASLVNQGIAVATIQSREYVPNGHDVGLTVDLGAGGYTPGNCQARTSDPFWCTHTNETNWQRFTMEVADRVGNDSFIAGHGVLIAQTRNNSTPRAQLIDANIDDIGRIDFYRPDGTPVPVVRGDPRQLDDATFHAGTISGSQYEYVENLNRLHFYVLDSYRDENGVLFYDVAVRNLDGAGAFQRGVSVAAPAVVGPVGGSSVQLRATVTNTGQAGVGVFDSDVFRITSTVDGEGWTVHLPYEVYAAKPGESLVAQAYATAGAGATESATVTLTATSESDPTQTMSVTYELTTTDVKVTLDTARALVDTYAAEGLVSLPDRQQLKAFLGVIARNAGRSSAQAWRLYSGIVENVPDTLARAALLASGDALRS